MRFARKLRLAFLAPPLVALAVLFVLLWGLLSEVLTVDARERLGDSLGIVTHVLRPALGESERALQEQVQALVSGGEVRITVIGSDGRVLADSGRDWEGLGSVENHADRPEVQAALRRGEGFATRRSTTVDRDLLYVARPVTTAGGATVVLRVAAPVTGPATLRSSLGRGAFLAGLFALAVLAAVSFWIERRLFRPLEELVDGANRMALGSSSSRLSLPKEDELLALARSLNRLSERVQEQILAVEAERSRLEVVGESMSEGVLVTDREGRATMVNPAFRRLFRVRGPVEGLSILELTRNIELDDMLRVTLETGQSGDKELQTLGKRTVAAGVTPLKDQSGAVVAARDVSDLLVLAEVRRDLVANVSHELKTPLAAIRGYAETLHDGALEDPPAAKRFVRRIMEQCRRLQALLEDLLTLSRLERREESLERIPTDLGAVLQRSAEVIEPIARERQVELQVDVDPVPPIEADAEGLEKLCLNLLDNAVKYNRPGGRVHVRLSRRSDELVLEVDDTGRGIPEAALPRLFERFYRVDRGRSRDEGGTGLGLAIVKHAAQRHGGTVEVESRLGEGSTFRVRLPLTGGGGEST